MVYIHSMREMIIVTNEELEKVIEGLERLINVYAKELYYLNQKRPKDSIAEYHWQLKVDRTNQVIDELRKNRDLM